MNFGQRILKMNKLKIICNGILISQIIFALFVTHWLNVHEIFPFFKWDLFHSIERYRVIPMIYIKNVQGVEYVPARNFYDFFNNNPFGGNFIVAHDDLREIWYVKDPEALKVRMQQIGEFLFRKYDSVVFDLKMVKVDMYEFYKTRNIIEVVQDYGTFTYSQK